jgi:ABC-type branched-subunit amino acid transport system substrate-binding protein
MNHQATTKNKKEVDELKKIVFLIIASLLILGLVLPGCAGGGGGGAAARNRPLVLGQISIAITGPMSDVQGINHWQGAQMAAAAINTSGGISMNATPYYVKLVKVDTNEVLGLPDEGVTALKAKIDVVDYVCGGFRTESVSAYRTVAMDEAVIMMNCGAATLRLQRSVNENYSKYKYWFKATPYNEIFLVTSCFKLTAAAVGAYVTEMLTRVGYMGCSWKDMAYAIAAPPNTTIKVAIIAESLEWCAGMITYAQTKLPTLLSKKGINMTIVGTWTVSDKAPDITTEMNQIAALKPHVIFTIFSGPVGKVYSKKRADMGLPALSVGINVEGQQEGIVTYTGGGCEYDMMLDTWGWGVNQSTKTGAFFNAYWAAKSDYPLYTAATYDALYALKAAMENTNSCEPSLLIPEIESSSIEGAGAVKTCYYPSGSVVVAPGVWALCQTQVIAKYPFLASLTVPGPASGLTPGSFCYSDIQPWSWSALTWTTSGGFCAHDTVYGPGYQTGMGTQWQNVTGTLRKVGWWPANIAGVPSGGDGSNPNVVIGALNAQMQAYLYWLGVIDNYGYWSFQYPGTSLVQIPWSWWLNCP